MRINYKEYIVFPYTLYRLNKTYTPDIVAKYGSQLALLFQNGFSFLDNSMTAIKEQMELFNNFETWDDYEEFVQASGCSVERDASPSRNGYKMVDSVLEIVLNKSSWALKDFINVKIMGNMYKENIKQMLDILETVFYSEDMEVIRVLNTVADIDDRFLVDTCLDLYDDEIYNILLIKYQALYKRVHEVHKKINQALLLKNDKGRIAIMGNVNDELYGSSGSFNPNTGDIIAKNGSSVYELKLLKDSAVSSESIRIKMLVLAKECVENGETDRTLTAFARGDNSNLEKVRQILADVCFSGIMVLLELKHGLTLLDEDTLNSKRAERIASELTSICKYTNYKSKEFT